MGPPAVAGALIGLNLPYLVGGRFRKIRASVSVDLFFSIRPAGPFVPAWVSAFGQKRTLARAHFSVTIT